VKSYIKILAKHVPAQMLFRDLQTFNPHVSIIRESIIKITNF